jgi:hypothetical protein
MSTTKRHRWDDVGEAGASNQRCSLLGCGITRGVEEDGGDAGRLRVYEWPDGRRSVRNIRQPVPPCTGRKS